MLVRLSVLSAFLAVIMVVAGCGGGGSSSSTVEVSSGHQAEGLGIEKAEFIQEADGLCSDFQAKAKPIRNEIEKIERSANPESPQNLVRLGELLNESIAEAEANLESIRELKPPEADEATIEKMLNSAQEGNGLGAEAGKALEEGETAGFGKRAKKIEAANNRAKAIAEGYGFKVCGQAP
jgi:hypothetical protein